MADAITLDSMGIPAAVIGTDRTLLTTGKTMARSHGIPDYPFVVIPWDEWWWTIRNSEDVALFAARIVDPVEKILCGPQGG